MDDLLGTVDLFYRNGRVQEAINLQATAAERDPAKNVGLARLGRMVGNVKLAERASKQAEQYLRKKINESPLDAKPRIELAVLYVDLNRIDEAHALLFDGLDGAERTPELARSQSELYILKYLRSVSVNGSEAKIELGLLDKAFRLDPTNPRVGEEVAGLAAAGVQGASEELVASLKGFLAGGTATTTTHALLSETYIAKGDLAQAIPHLEQVKEREPDYAKGLNNLAYCLAVAQPDRMDEALQHSERAVSLSKGNNADFFDTYAMILDLAGRRVQAITAIERAIEISVAQGRDAPPIRDRAAEIYRNAGNEEMAQLQEAKSKQLAAQIEAARAAASASQTAPEVEVP